MRQTAQEPEEIAFRQALENLRYRDCTADDIALLRSRIATTNDQLSVDHTSFKNVSIITSLNRDKDQINKSNSARFAAENGEALEDFYSFDKMSNAEPKRVDPKKKRRVYSKAKSISKSMQVGLWNQPPCTSEQIPGKLSLCIGMPVLIRNNEATELCITKGQEARIVGWTAMKYPKWPGRKYLDVLYVELIDPPHAVNLPHLPKNVVPLTRNAETVEAQLPNDEYVNVSRSQIPILPNFAMTDYSSQGKTREFNVVDLAECRNFQAMYTCLSRGTSLKGTLIVHDFKNEHLRGELDGALRQEYRELKYLTSITDMLYEGILPSHVIRPTRWETIRAYREWKAGDGLTIEKAPAFPETNDFDPPTEDIVYEVSTIAATTKRKEQEANSAPPRKRRRVGIGADPVLANETWAAPTGPLWDARDWSCAYDVWTFILHCLWLSDRVKWTRVLKTYSATMQSMVGEFEGMQRRDPEEELTQVRDIWRSTLRETYPSQYPTGTVGTDIIALTEHLLAHPLSGCTVMSTCTTCGLDMTNSVTSYRSFGRFSSVRAESMSIQHFVDDCFTEFQTCGSCKDRVVVKHAYSDMLTFEIVTAEDVLLNGRIEVGTWGTYRLTGVIYYGDHHFTSRVITRDNKVYFHDGMDGGHSTYEGILGGSFNEDDLRECGGRSASMAVYALADRSRPRGDSDTDCVL
ncbi:hypothetical protein DFP72DRAFT_826254 [Ephemerocybe angulata]|uniref:Uncharacterized protein n=1 Tax=Ephemerocybe angulata TaxID=980116 RepID=A0A8H6HC25_9AGAR|nr:hypothetical protein DFP72DRAFT_826254 [Tulosesus angulatus]